MAEQDIADIAATADGDTSWGDDLRGAIATLALTRPGIVAETLGSTRLNADGAHFITSGPWSTSGTSTLAPGVYRLGLSMVRGGTPDSVSIEVTTLGTTSNIYYVMYDMADDGHPTNKVNSWGPFDATSTGIKTLTSQTESTVAGMYWCGSFTPTGNGGSPAARGFLPSYGGLTWPFSGTRRALHIEFADSTPRATLSGTMRTNPSYDATSDVVTYLMGKDT